MEKDLIRVTGAPSAWKLEALCLKLAKALRRGRWVSAQARVVLSVSCVDANKMKALNRRHRGKNSVTDILSFEQPKQNSRLRGRTKKPGMIFLGDIVLCIPVVRIQAVQMKHAVLDEVSVLMVHGVMHLLGHDHEKSAKDAAKMVKAETRLLKLLGHRPTQISGLVERSTVNTQVL